jgi:hypothetical protein
LASTKALLRCGGHDGGKDDMRLLFPACMAAPRNSTLWASASRSCALLTALLDPCARADSTCDDKVVMSQMAMLQPELQCTCHTFWQAPARHGTKALGERETANTGYAYACSTDWACRLLPVRRI